MATKYFSTHTKCKRGDVVTVSYDRYARNAIPVNPKVYRIRSDITWEFVLQGHSKQLPKAQYLNGTLTSLDIAHNMHSIILITHRNCSKGIWASQQTDRVLEHAKKETNAVVL